MSTSPSCRVLRFGSFEADVNAGELRKQGLRIKLQDQPFQILVMLLERPGELVTREEIQQRLWPGDTFVDFDHGLNNAVNRLREALGDSAETPRFIETLPRKGYRFHASVNGQANADPASVSGQSGKELQVRQSSLPIAARPDASSIPSTDALRVSLPILAAGIAATILMFMWLRPTSVPKIVGSTQITHDGLQKRELVTDGSRLYFTEFAGGHSILGQVSTAGGETAHIAIPFTNFILSDGLSPNRSELLLAASPTDDFTDDSRLWSLPLPTGSPRRVGEVVTWGASWSRDGKTIIYGHGYDLYVCQADGSRPRKLATISGYPSGARWSPEGDIVRFTKYDVETSATSLWEVASDGTGLHRLLSEKDDSPQECCGNWTADGKYYFFQSAGNIWVLQEKAGFLRRANKKPVQLTFGPLAMTYPVPSTDGKTLFVVGQQRRAEVVSYDPKSSRFVPYMSDISGGQLDFSRDGNWIAYVADPEETLWRSKFDGSERQQLTYSPLRVALPRWSPDGKRIACMASEPGKQWRIFMISTSDGSAQDLLPGQANVGDPTWSPDGTSVAFGSVLFAGKSSAAAIQVLDLRSKQVSTMPGSQGMYSPRWSPNGRFLAALPTDSQKLMIFDFTTHKWSALVNRRIGYPSWSKDSKYIFFDDSSFTEDPAFYRVKISDRSLHRVVSLKDMRQFVAGGLFSSWMGTWTGLTPDGSPLLQRDISTQEIYALDLQLP
jgi:Tol biopolymer transport system component/DNA-binding winged helix-turn-helix (wHTH) protein